MDETIKLWLDMLDDKTLNGLMREVSDVEGSIKNAETIGTIDYIPVLETYLEVLKDMIKEQKSKKGLLVVIDMQNDFIDGSLGTAEAVNIIPNVIEKINNWEGDIIATRDTHFSNYLETKEGRNLPVPHCVIDTEGHKIHKDIFSALTNSKHFSVLNKLTFGSTALPEIIRGLGYNYVELVGLCTDICVVSNALLLKASYPELDIAVDASCCAGVTPKSHNAAIQTMRMCQIKIIGE